MRFIKMFVDFVFQVLYCVLVSIGILSFLFFLYLAFMVAYGFVTDTDGNTQPQVVATVTYQNDHKAQDDLRRQDACRKMTIDQAKKGMPLDELKGYYWGCLFYFNQII